MRYRKLLWLVPVAGAVGLGTWADRWLGAAGQPGPDVKPAVSLPVTRVVMFNSGVGYVARSGEVDGDARVDLQFPETDVNDLLKSMTLQDFGGGRVAAVSYESREPVARTLGSFAVNLSGNPTLAQILGQARGERVEVSVAATAAGQPGNLSGTIVGLERQKVPAGTNSTVDVDVLNLWCGDGLRAVKLPDVQRLRFANPVLESEFRRALDVLALSHDAQKKAVSLHFAGDGKRKVQVSYVTEAPVWKTSYRLVLDPDGKPFLQGWAVVENPTDEDWSDVKMALVSGRPISFKMDLYNPLYVPRPTVEPELFASLRPPTYRGGFGGRGEAVAELSDGEARPGDGPAGEGRNRAPMAKAAAAPGGFGGGYKRMDEKGEADKQNMDALRRSAGGRNLQADRDYAKKLGGELQQRMDLGAAASAATASQLGDFFQYVIDHPVTLNRQKSALLPVVTKDVEASRVSIYNPAVQAKHPLLGLRFKNTTGMHLAQGPVTVFEGSTYAGDTRVLDIQPNDERLVSYAVDLGTEVDPQNGPGSTRITAVKAVKGVVTTTIRLREEKKYRIANRSGTDRTVLIEHPNRTNGQFKLVEPAKPTEDTPEFYRFQTQVPAGKDATLTVIEEREIRNDVALTNSAESQIRYFLSLNEASPAFKAKLQDALKLKATWDGERRELQQVEGDLKRLTADQDRIRRNLRETPKEAKVYTTYLNKLDTQEKEIDALTARQKELMGKEFAAKKTYEDFLSGITD